jgi:SagB-type dehydrogenase family enzyme
VGRNKEVQRSPGLVFYWSASGFECMDCVSGRRYAVSPGVAAVLDNPGSLDVNDRASRVAREALLRAGLLTQEKNAASTWPWAAWMPEAAFFHFGTYADRFETDSSKRNRQLVRQARSSPQPPPTKKIEGEITDLPEAEGLAEMSQTLLARRTWRNFTKRAIGLSELATLLALTFGVQHRASVKGQGKVVLKTSPSAGARHPIEAYVLSSNVKGLAAGVYHYDAGAHHLVALKKGMTKQRIKTLLGGQSYFSDAGAVIVMSAVFARSMWKYPSARAYRSILIDAGHLGQTFCLVATALKLAPFCTMAFRERDLDAAIGVDGVLEGSIYIVGVGRRGSIMRPGRIQGGTR